jgi:dihydrolipoamide dehydrogenase
MSQVEVKVPDIGDFADVPVIELFVKVGDSIKVDDSICTLESDKATMDVPSSVAGVVSEVRVKLGDRVGEGAVLIKVDAAGAGSSPLQGGEAGVSASTARGLSSDEAERRLPGRGGDGVKAPQGKTHPPPDLPLEGGGTQPQAASHAGAYAGSTDIECDMLVLGAGPGGYSAAFRSADLGLKTVMVERYATLGGVCLNVGCIPSKALLHVAAVMDEAEHMASAGITFAKPTVDIDALRAHKDKVVGKLTGGLAGMAKGRKVDVVRGYGSFLDPNHVEVELTSGDAQEKTGEKKVIRFKQCIIAAGSAAVHLPFIPRDPRIVDSTGALELRQVPGKMLVIGGGIIGLEMATVYSTLGARVDVVEMLDALMQGPDRDAVKVWEKQNAHRFDNIMLNTKTVAVEARDDGLWVTFEGAKAPEGPQRYDMILQAAGRSPNGKKIAADKAGVEVTDRGFIPVDAQMRTNVPNIFAIGDIVGNPMLAHKAVHEAHVAAEVAAGQKSAFDATVIPGVAYTHPEVAWVGYTEEQAKKEGRKVETAKFPWAASGRAIANGADYGFTKLIFDAETHRVIGGAIVGPSAGDMIGEVCLAIEMGADAVDIGKTIHPHPTLGETVGLTAEVAHGSCTDLPAARKK